jgi:hypothetical protein
MEMYKNQLAVAIKHNGKILRETKDLVHLPFGSEFSVLVKNLNSRRVKFSLQIDGTDVLSGEHIVVNANSETEIKRFIRNGNMNEGNAFKFIERTAAIEDGPRGIKVDDGVVRVEFWFEQEQPIVTTTYHRHIDYWDDYYRRYPYWGPFYSGLRNDGPLYNSTLIGSLGATSSSNLGEKLSAGDCIDSSEIRNTVSRTGSVSGASLSTSSFNAVSKSLDSAKADYDAKLNDAGITVPGSKVEQKFTAVYGFNAEAQSHVIILRMVGMVGNVEVTKPVTVKHKQKCTTCGKLNKVSSKFCSGCGTALDLL